MEFKDVFGSIDFLKNDVKIELDNDNFQNTVIIDSEVAGDKGDIRLSVEYLPLAGKSFYQQVMAAGDTLEGTQVTLDDVLDRLNRLAFQEDIAWQLFPLELEFGSGQTCSRCLDRWQRAGVFERLHRILLAEPNAASELDWTRACVDGSAVRAVRAKEREPRLVRHRSTGGRRAASIT
ncbi:transposase [Streptomyces albospinus]|nr:transposase [Streptomyces albospinus]